MANQKKIIANHLPDEETGESARKIQDLQTQLDELHDAYWKLEKRVSVLESDASALREAVEEIQHHDL